MVDDDDDDDYGRVHHFFEIKSKSSQVYEYLRFVYSTSR